jgi:thiol-disulfide isomerase/thioredoxin
MSEVSSAADKGGPHRFWIVAAVVAALAVAAAIGVLYANRRNATELAEPGLPQIVHKGPLARYATGSLAKLDTWAAPRATPQIAFKDAQQKPLSLADYRGKVVVMNIWAHWCAPCIVEMPTLAALQKRYQGSDLVVTPVSVDREKDFLDAKNFIDVNDPLPLLLDPNFTLPASLKLRGLPSTVIYDRQGREVARLEGEAKWDTPEAYAFFDALLRRK